MARIVIDDREQASGIPDLLRELEDVDVEIRRLRVGDYLIDGRVIVERKTMDDFATSIVDTRLFRQATLLVKSPYRPAVLLEGLQSRSGLAADALNGALISLALIFDIPVLRSVDIYESTRLLAYSARQLSETIAHGGGRRQWKPKKLHTRRAHVLTSLPGIGWDRAARLLETFGTVENCIRADVDSLCKVPGIGRKTAEAIRLVLSAPNGEG